MSVERARSLRTHSTRSERIVWNWLRDRGLYGLKFRRQHPFGSYVLDFYCAEMKLCVEVDGSSHDTEERYRHDEERSAELAKHGITVIRIRNEDVSAIPFACCDFLVCEVARVIAMRQGRTEKEVLREWIGRTSPSP